MGVDLSSKLTTTAAAVNRVTQAQAQVAKAVESKDPAAIAAATTQATSQVGQALQADSFQPASKAQAAQASWASSYAAGAPSLTGAPATQAVSGASASNPMNFTPQQLQAIGAKVGEATQSAPATASNPMGFTQQQLYNIGTQVGNSIAQSQNVVSGADAQKSGFDSKSNVVAQSTDTNCAAAAVATLSTCKTDKPADKTGQEIEQNLTDKYSGPNGTTPKQVTEMLASQGLKVTASYTKLDQNALDSSLKTGDKAIAMVDSNAINPSTQGNGPGKAHWVTIDGMDKNGSYQVKDPASGRSYYVSPEQLDKAMGAVRSSTDTGGMFTVRNTEGTASQDELAQQSAGDAQKLGDAPGTGSSRYSFSESS